MKDKKLAQYSPLPIRIISRIAFAIVGLPKLSNIVWTEHFFAIIGLPAVRLCPRIARRKGAKEREKQWEKGLRRLQNATDLKIPCRSKKTRSKPQKEVKIYI
jgi:hypothetical protein